MLGHHLRLWININPALGHRSQWCAVCVKGLNIDAGMLSCHNVIPSDVR